MPPRKKTPAKKNLPRKDAKIESKSIKNELLPWGHEKKADAKKGDVKKIAVAAGSEKKKKGAKA